jgi:hypothetical protein
MTERIGCNHLPRASRSWIEAKEALPCIIVTIVVHISTTADIAFGL